MAGRVLVSPDGDRISPERLRGLLWRETLERRRAKAHSPDEKQASAMVTVVRIDQGDWHRERFGSVAG